MATMTVSLPDPVKEWIEAQIRQGEYATASDYLLDLVQRDRARVGEELSLHDVRQKLAAARESGVTDRTVEDVFAEALAIAKVRAG